MDLRVHLAWAGALGVTIALAGPLAGAAQSSEASGLHSTSAAAVKTDATSAPASPTRASIVLKTLAVRSESRSGYQRTLFNHWRDADGDSCDTREEVLIRQSQVSAQVGPGCRVYSGRWTSAYDAVVVTDPSTLDIDHVVALAEAWDSGASRWSFTTRQAFANDLAFTGSLIAVTASSNRSKSDRDPAEWLPGNSAYRCTYVTTWIAVKYRWSLSIDSAEKSALQRQVTACGNPHITLPAKAPISLGGGTGGGGTGGSGTGGSGTGGGGTGGGTDPRFDTCTAAKAAGYGPYYRGSDTEYSWYRDADSDGIVCE